MMLSMSVNFTTSVITDRLKLVGTYRLTLTGNSVVFGCWGQCGNLTDAIINISDNTIQLVKCDDMTTRLLIYPLEYVGEHWDNGPKPLKEGGAFWDVDLVTAVSILNEQIASQTVERFALDGPEYVKAIAELEPGQ